MFSAKRNEIKQFSEQRAREDTFSVDEDQMSGENVKRNYYVNAFDPC